MDDSANLKWPPVLSDIHRDTLALGFSMASESLTGALLRTLAASKPSGRFLELGTGTGIATAWLLEGMDEASQLTTVENDAAAVAIAQRHLGHDQRVTFVVSDAGAYLGTLQVGGFDFIFADTWPGKYTHLDSALSLLKPGGLYVIDDMLPQPNWPECHSCKVAKLISELELRDDLFISKLSWASGVIVATKRFAPD